MHYNHLKPKQTQTLLSVMNDNDTLAIMPTGYGKTLIFELLPYLMQEKYGVKYCIIIASPLNAIIQQQLERTPGHAVQITADFFEEDQDHDVEGMLMGKYKYVLL